MDRMRVGGIQILLVNLMKTLDKLKESEEIGITFELLVLDDGLEYPLLEEVKKLGVTTHQLKGIWLRKPWNYIGYCKALHKFFGEHNDYQAIHMNSGPKNFFLLWYGKRFGIPVRIAHSHNSGYQTSSKLQKALGDVFKIPLRRVATNYIACSEKAGQWMFGKNLVEQGKVEILPNGVDLEEFRFSTEVRAQVRKELDIEDKIVIGNVGRFTTQKNHKFLIKIFKEIHQKNQDTMLLLAGIGELMEDCEKQVEELGLGEVVKFLGFRSDVTDLLQGMDLFLMPSLYEGFPVTGVEAQASGLPCVFTDTITREAKLLDNVKFLSLESDAGIWAEEVLGVWEIAKIREQREGSYHVLKHKGFDIQEMIMNLRKVYIS